MNLQDLVKESVKEFKSLTTIEEKITCINEIISFLIDQYSKNDISEDVIKSFQFAINSLEGTKVVTNEIVEAVLKSKS